MDYNEIEKPEVTVEEQLQPDDIKQLHSLLLRAAAQGLIVTHGSIVDPTSGCCVDPRDISLAYIRDEELKHVARSRFPRILYDDEVFEEDGQLLCEDSFGRELSVIQVVTIASGL